MLLIKKAPAEKTRRFALLAAVAAIMSFGSTAQAAPPVITILPSPSILFSYSPGGTIPGSQVVMVTSDIPATLQNYTVTYPQGSGGWLTVFPPSGSGGLATPANLSLFLNPGFVQALPAGQYIAQVSLTMSPAPTGGNPTIAILLTVAGGGTNFNQTITVAPTSLAFAFSPGSAVPAAQTLAVSTSDSTPVSAAVVTDDGGSWLLLSPTSSVTPGNISVSVNPALLAGGTYTATITVKGSNSVAQIPVTLTVGTVGLTVNPMSIAINEPQNYGPSAFQPLTITGTGALPVQINGFAADGNWLQVDANTGVTPVTVNVRANDSGLMQGTYMGTVTVQSGPGNSVQVPVTLTVGAPATLQLQPASVAFTYQITTAQPVPITTKVNSLTGSAQNFTLAPVTYNGGNWLTASAVPTTTPGVVTIGVNPTGLAVGTYSGVINVTPAGTNTSPQPIVVSLTVKSAPVPTILSVTSAASYASGTVAPGEIVTIFGSNIGPAALTVPTPGTAPQTLANTSITFDGIPAPIYYASSGQTSVQVPYNIAAGQTVVKLTYNGVPSTGTTLKSLPAFPGLFTSDSSGQRQLAALNADLSVNSAANPVARGTVLVLYGTGEGQTNPASVEGARVPVIIPLPQTPFAVTVSIGGQPATVQYAGETPGLLSGLLQINVIVPPATPVGANIPVLVTVNGQFTQPNVTVAVK